MRENSAKPDWFPLSVHLNKPATPEHWARCIGLRLAVTQAANTLEWKAAAYRSAVIADNEMAWPTDAREKLLGIRCVTAFEAFTLADAYNVPANAAIKALAEKQSRGNYDLSEKAQNLKASSGEIDDERYRKGFGYRYAIMANLALDDATLKEHFSVWLRFMRQQINEAAGPVRLYRIDDDFFNRCHSMRLLAAFDLITWRELSGATYSDAAIASWLWPDSGPLCDDKFVDRSDRFRKVTKPLIEDVMQWPTVERIEQRQAQAHFEAEQARRAAAPEQKVVNLIPEKGKAA